MRTLLAMFCAVTLATAPVWADRVETVSPTTTRFIFELEQFADTSIVYGPADFVEATINFAPIGDVTLRIERPGSTFKFTDLSPWSESNGIPDGVSDTWGARSLDPFTDLTNPAPFMFTATLPLGYAVLVTGIEFGDFGPSDYDEFHFDGEPGFLDNNEGGLYGGEFFKSLFTSGITNAWFRGDLDPVPSPPGPIYSFSARGGGPDQPMSLFWDNIVLNVVAVDDLPQVTVAPAGLGFPNSEDGPGYLPGPPPPPAQPIPEPGTLVLLGVGAAALALLRRRRR